MWFKRAFGDGLMRQPRDLGARMEQGSGTPTEVVPIVSAMELGFMIKVLERVRENGPFLAP